MPREQSRKVSRSDTYTRRQCLDRRAFAIKCAFFGDQASRAVDNGSAAPPRWTERSGFRSATQAGTKARPFGGGGTREKGNVARKRRTYRADRPAVDAGGSDPGEKAPVIGRIAGHPRPLAFRMVKHGNLPATTPVAPPTESDSGERFAMPHAT
jgi:hypothetical protein